ncbi:HAD family hydrolase [Pseudomaricurvus sp. HS19]|uniref:HAD family hydrolase n=1 Tax=Pseudomaricurvus sp. HS19 TaxID=2692626 RepID=UPI001371F086|nr:HAD family hydrolase [Pseudomaricurvus sp. HS19]MYM62060.1 HAD-IA family hydrolase [Pseudomaricurvus sp. HS19]
MLKALFFDMDDTLCDTRKANRIATEKLAAAVEGCFPDRVNGQQFAASYIKGIYRDWTEGERARYLPIAEGEGEGVFRVQLIRDLLQLQGVGDVTGEQADFLQSRFDQDRIDAFDFYPGIAEFLRNARQFFTLVVITNGPEFSQVPKVERVRMADYVDHVIIGGQEPEQKPARSIFAKALQLAACEPHEAIHVGDSLAADIAGAHNSEITSVWIRHQQPLDAELGIEPHHTVMHPEEIPQLIRQLHPH